MMNIIPHSEIYKKFIVQEPQLFRFWNILTNEQKKELCSQLSKNSTLLLSLQNESRHNEPHAEERKFEPFGECAYSGNEENRKLGKQLIALGRVGCVLLAGGQGTRLQHKGPKGTFPVSLIKRKSLFQICGEKVKAAGLQAGRPLQLAVMTSEDNDIMTRDFFHQNQFFGLSPSQVSFFVQGSLPLLDSAGKPFLQTPWQLAMGADGNGNSLIYFAKAGLLKHWQTLGIEYMHVILIDNPLADPFDAELAGYHHRQKVDITLKCTEKVDPEEKVGVLVKQDGRCKVVEYSEMPTQEKYALHPTGKLKHCTTNLSLFCFSLSFLDKITWGPNQLPLHKAWKAAQYVDVDGNVCQSDKPMAWKFETFIFDWLNYTEKVAAMIYPRSECFAPLKNAKGNDSPETVHHAIQEMDKIIFREITQLPPPNFPFELAADFYYPTERLSAKWKNRQTDQNYVES